MNSEKKSQIQGKDCESWLTNELRIGIEHVELYWYTRSKQLRKSSGLGCSGAILVRSIVSPMLKVMDSGVPVYTCFVQY